MPRFLIEVPHDSEKLSCARTVKVFLSTGSHFLTHADWGCTDGDHRAWFVASVENKDEARSIVPPQFRHLARITRLNSFNMEEIDEILYQHQT